MNFFIIVSQYINKAAVNELGSNILEKNNDCLNEIIQRTNAKICQADNLNSEDLRERVRNVQSLLVNCASDFSLK